MNLQRFEDLLLGGKLQDARAAALDLVAHYDDEAHSCTMAGEHGEATRAERKRDELRQRLREIEFRIELAGRGPFRCPRCATRGIPASSAQMTKLTCSACGMVWDGEADLRFLDVVRAPITLTGRQVFILGPPGRESGDEAKLAAAPPSCNPVKRLGSFPPLFSHDGGTVSRRLGLFAPICLRSLRSSTVRR